MSVFQKLDKLADQFDLPGRITREYAALYRTNPQIARKLLDDLRAITGVTNGQTRQVGRVVTTNYDRLLQAFGEVAKNVWMTKPGMMKAASLTENSLHTVFYSHRDEFDARANPKGGLMKLYRPKKSILENFLLIEAVIASKGGPPDA